MEIEVKARLKDASATQQKLEALGCVFSEPKTQDDTVFVAKPGTIDVYLSNDVFPRLRIENGTKAILTVKKPVQKSPDMLVKYEHEVVVSSADEARGMLELLGLHAAVRTVKKRRTAHYGEYEICIDEIENLDTFIELEVMGEAEGAGELQKKMWEFLASLGIEASDQVTRGYDVLMLEKVH